MIQRWRAEIESFRVKQELVKIQSKGVSVSAFIPRQMDSKTLLGCLQQFATVVTRAPGVYLEKSAGSLCSLGETSGSRHFRRLPRIEPNRPPLKSLGNSPTATALVVSDGTAPYIRVLKLKVFTAVGAFKPPRFIAGRESPRHRVATPRTDDVPHVPRAHLRRSSFLSKNSALCELESCLSRPPNRKRFYRKGRVPLRRLAPSFVVWFSAIMAFKENIS